MSECLRCPDAPGCEEHGCYWQWATDMSSVGPVGAETEQRVQRDGCGCPSWVVQCGHYDGWVVYIAKPYGDRPAYPYDVHGPTTILVESEDINVRRHTGCCPTPCKELTEAQAEFERRAEELRRG